MAASKSLKFVALILAIAAMVLLLHGKMDDMEQGMSDSCAMICFMQAGAVSDLPLHNVFISFVAAIATLLIVTVLSLVLQIAPIRSHIFLERHRYLMKIAVMLR